MGINEYINKKHGLNIFINSISRYFISFLDSDRVITFCKFSNMEQDISNIHVWFKNYDKNIIENFESLINMILKKSEKKIT